MGQSSSLACCCCDRDRRATAVMNDALQEKLLSEDEKTKISGGVDDAVVMELPSQPTNGFAASGMMALGIESDEDERNDSQDQVEEDEDEEETKPKQKKKPLGASYLPSANANAWDLSAADDTMASQFSIMPSESSLLDGDVGSALSRDPSARDSYGSSREMLESTHEGDEDEDDEGEHDPISAAIQRAVLRRRALPQDMSARVFDDTLDLMSSQGSTSRGLRELAEHDRGSDEFDSFGSQSSSMRSFLSRHSGIDSSDMPLVESSHLSGSMTPTEGGTEDDKAPRSGPRTSAKRKSKKRR